ncbi:GntR family transcriptional regulator [Streptomyces sp. NBC_00124]|uniref:GntR family transcriptional regulator n=1 Tax=Streptomyces sp. NBC_00124 TaxID=2975662 RepID=UPI00225655CC|nr:GntR family transcriptional regulator [Streptomyces sp. NBC_00124]MCX5364062.1 GntR family transcriptional regulator [Streptomyces sp. NBC_00124]
MVTQAEPMQLDRTRPLWRQIAAEIIGRIKDGTYPPGSRVPSTLEIAQEFSVVNATAAKAMRFVREEGWTRGEVGLGTFVADPLPSAPEAPQPSA